MRLGYDLTIEQTQKLVMTPELIQAIQILQFNTQELDNYVQEQLLTNPVLEQGSSSESGEAGEADASENDYAQKSDEYRSLSENYTSISQEKRENSTGALGEGSRELSTAEWLEHIKERDYDDISYKQGEYSKDDKEYSYEQFVTSDVTLPEHLMFQLQFAPLKKSCRTIGKYIIESLDDNGYMTLTIDEIARAMNVDTENVKIVLDAIHTFDPAGVAAADLRECLLIQLEHNGGRTEISEQVICNYLEDIAANRLGLIAKELGVSVKEIQDVSDMIRTLEPKPGRQFASQATTRYIVPDIMVEKINGEYVVSVNESSTPKLMVSSYYEKVLQESNNDPNLTKFLSGRLNSAIWLIKSIEQRKQTIYNVVSAVVKYQEEFFENGPKYLKTLTLKQIAEEVGIHESTVSRSINGKYMQSPRGVFEIKYFFTSGVAGNQGESISSKSIKTFIKEIVSNEDPKSPYSDQDMVKLLGERGIDISRRTVAKYRDEMNILSSSKRKRY
ncbi:RNA polymerase factor sigma-54 [Clostridium aminobutyricum]|uniref:RNA polymerase factor sigma-54 n=1 Tax=Clostridium aminobutyricum TaxID=33953 RepID=A0A939D6J3_CLOAM|nr:RNA polymerase factor sigma-54 [Clostridium aminobutyricum]MBN7772012.1 RNA polymerase factor sigma-54 [Clostridium aminobutyricum]